MGPAATILWLWGEQRHSPSCSIVVLHRVQDPDPQLKILATFDGNGSPPFPNNETLHTGLTGCVGNATFVFGFWDYQDKFTNGPNEKFFLNSVNYAMDPYSCIVTESPSAAPSDQFSSSPTQAISASPTAFASQQPTVSISSMPSSEPSSV